MEPNQVNQLALVLKSTPKSSSTVFSISTRILEQLNTSFETEIEDGGDSMTASFNIRIGTPKSETLQDLKYIYSFIQQTKTLKLISDVDYSAQKVDISKFRNINLLEVHNVDVNTIKGIQKIRSQLQKLVCCRSLDGLSDILMKCGDDNSESYCWNELKEASFVSNGLEHLDGSLEFIPWLNVLDLSHNQIRDVGEEFRCLTSLKHLNLSFNQLEKVPLFRGPICGQLQNLILKNNFIEDISGLQFLTNICVLDLSNNCLIEHKNLVSIAHLATLQWLNLKSNPLSYHPHHRAISTSYLHINITTFAHFILDELTLEKSLKKVIGSLHPRQIKISSSHSNDSMTSSTEKIRKVRHVQIEEQDTLVERQRNKPVLTPKTSQLHLETKKQIEDLRQQHGESWLNKNSGLAVQNVLGLAVPPLAETPSKDDLSKTEDETETNNCDKSDLSYLTAFDVTHDFSEDINDDDLDLDGEECIFLATPLAEDDQIFLVIAKKHISEKECTTSNERIRWHINSVLVCEKIADLQQVKVVFDTMRKDRKQRIYEMDDEELEKFLVCMKDRMAQIPKRISAGYQCMKCSTKFAKTDDDFVRSKDVFCPKCASTLIVVEDL